MPLQDIQLGPWRPDQGDLQHDGMAVAKNVYPIPNGYSLHPKADAVSTSTIDAIARGGYGTKDTSGNANLFVGNATKLYRRTGTTFSDVSKSGGYTTAAADHWEFAQYDKTLIATNYADTPQKFVIGTSSLFQDIVNTFSATGASFNGSDTYYTRGADLTGIADGKVGSISVWVKPDSSGIGQDFICQASPDGTSAGFAASIDGNGFFAVVARNAANTLILNIKSSTNLRDGSWHHVIASWDLTDTAKRHLYVDGVSDLAVNTYTNDTIDYTDTDFSIGATPAGGGVFHGGIAELWFNTEYVDASVQATREKWRDASGAPVSLGSDGSTPTGTQPVVYVNGGADGFATNLGTGGGFTKNGSPTDVILASGASAPKARHVGVIGDFTFFGNTSDTPNGAVPYRLQWSAIGDPDDLPTPGTQDAQDKQADEEYLDPEFGPIRGIAGGKDFGLVFQESAITRFTYIGGTAIFEVDTFERQRGLIAPRAFAQVGTKTYFISQGGAYVTDGVNVEPIGDGVIDQTLIDDIDRSNLNYLSTAVDLDNKLIYFAIPGSTGSDKVYIYHYLENRWAYGVWTDLIGDATAQVGCIVQGQTLDSSKNPRVWVLGGYNEGAGVLHKLREFTGDFSPFTLRTAVQEFPQMFYMDGASIYGDSNSTFGPSTDVPFKVYASESSLIGISDGESDVHTASTTGAANARTGRVDFRITGRTASFELSASAAITTPTIQKVQKFRLYFQPSGDA